MTVLTERRADVAVLRLDNPPLNGLSLATRQALLTGRNHQNADMAGITEIATGQPG